jgi:hypothetical protein
MNDTITVNNIEYIRKGCVSTPSIGNRHVVVVDRGWIFAGDLVRENGRLKLSRAVHVFKWDSIGFPAVIATEKADLRPIADVDIPEGSEIFCIPVHESWGLKK